MRILHLPNAYFPWTTGGKEVYCHRLCQKLQNLGVDTLVAFHQNPLRQETLGEQNYEDISVRVLPPIPDHNRRLPAYTKVTASAIGFPELLAEYKPDVVHFHDFSPSSGLTHMREAKKAGCKVVITYHSPGQSCPQRSLLYQSKSICDGKILIDRCSECRLSSTGLNPTLAKLAVDFSPRWLDPENSNPLSRIFTAKQRTEAFYRAWLEMIELVDILHVHAQWVKEMVKFNGAPEEKVYLFRTGGPDLNSFSSSINQTQSSNYLNLAFAGRCTYIKGIHVIVEAVKLLPKNLPLKITFFGPYWEEEEYGRNLQKQIEGDKRFELKHNIPHSDFLKMLVNYDACLVPSLCLETGPLIVLEAFAAGIPVVGSHLGGIAELVQDGIDGLLFEPGNSDQLAAVIEELVESKFLLEKLKANVNHPKTMSALAQDILHLYQSLVFSPNLT